MYVCNVCTSVCVYVCIYVCVYVCVYSEKRLPKGPRQVIVSPPTERTDRYYIERHMQQD